jgi:cobalamin biosynthesis Co2+ chelatase CbiK
MVKYDSDNSLSTNHSSTISNSLSFDLYNPYTMKKLDIKKCDNYEVKTPIQNKTIVNQTLYQQLKNQSIDIFNPNDTAFTSRCTPIFDPETGLSTTLNYRIKNYYQNKTIACGNGCSYKSIDQNDYVTCECSGATDTGNEFVNKVGDFILNGFSNINIGVFTCYMQVFNVILNLIVERSCKKCWIICINRIGFNCPDRRVYLV